jgi:hypothetical protein
MAVETVETKWGTWNGHMLKRFKDGYAEARRDSLREFQIDGQPVVTQFAKYMIEFLEGQGLEPCDR